MRALLLTVLLLCAAPALPQDRADGEELFRRCSFCHASDGETARTGPPLGGVVGRRVAAIDGYHYSEVMLHAGHNGMVWSKAELDRFLANPRQAMPGTKMGMIGLRDATERAAIIDYLAGLSAGADDNNSTAFDVDPVILAIEGDPEWGEYLSAECTSCHQIDGGNNTIPSIAGLPEKYFVTLMHAYKRKTRTHQVMEMMAGRLSDEEIAALAAYFAALE